MAVRLDIVCDICRIRIRSVTLSSLGCYFGDKINDTSHQNSVLQFIRDHHACDPTCGVRIVNLDLAEKYESYTDLEN